MSNQKRNRQLLFKCCFCLKNKVRIRFIILHSWSNCVLLNLCFLSELNLSKLHKNEHLTQAPVTFASVSAHNVCFSLKPAHGSGAGLCFYASRVKGQMPLKPAVIQRLLIVMNGFRPHVCWLLRLQLDLWTLLTRRVQTGGQTVTRARPLTLKSIWAKGQGYDLLDDAVWSYYCSVLPNTIGIIWMLGCICMHLLHSRHQGFAVNVSVLVYKLLHMNQNSGKKMLFFFCQSPTCLHFLLIHYIDLPLCFTFCFFLLNEYWNPSFSSATTFAMSHGSG